MEYNLQLIGRRIKTARKKKRYTQDYVSARLNIGEKFLSQIECGKAGLSVQTLISLCNVLEVSPNYILLADGEFDEEDSVSAILKGLTPQQRYDAQEILSIFARNCRE